MSFDDCPSGVKPKSNSGATLQALDYWRLCDEINIFQAALLIVGEDPSQNEYIENWDMDKRPAGYEAAKTALRNAVESKKLPAEVTEIFEDCDGGFKSIGADWNQTRIEVSEIKKWLAKRGIATGFFFPDGRVEAEYLDTNQDHYAPKLAAAINAWQAVNSDPGLLKGKTPKRALEIWLRAHANDYGLTKDDGNPNETGIQEVSKIANWDTKGGAPRTNG